MNCPKRKKKQTDIASPILDFGKVLPNRLALKLDHHGVRENALNWISAFLSNNRECPFCPGTVEDEEHVLMSCPKYNTVRDGLFKHAAYCNPVFLSLNITDKFIFLMSSSNITNRCAKACSDILDIRSMFLNSSY